MRVFGAGSDTCTPFTTRSARLEPSALLVLIVLVAIATTPFAVIRPLRILTFPSVALLTASDASAPSPLTMANASCAVTIEATVTLLA